MHFIKLFSEEKDAFVAEEKGKGIKEEIRCGIGGMVVKDTWLAIVTEDVQKM